MAHRDRFKPLSDLAQYLDLAVNGDVRKAVTQIKCQWIVGKRVRQLTAPEQYQQWLDLADSLQTKELSKSRRFAWIWERMFLFEVVLEQRAYSNAFLSFAQTVEAILNLQHETENWLKRGYLELPEHVSEKEFSPSLGALIIGWEKKHQIPKDSRWHQTLDRIRQIRNKIAHEGTAFDRDTLIQAVAVESVTQMSHPELLRQMQKVLKKISHPASSFPETILLRSLYQWGLEVLQR